MALKCKVIGIGAAGNKAAAVLMKNKVLERQQIMMLNTTDRDIPSEYRTDLFIKIGNTGGCGKSRVLAKKLMLEALQTGMIPIDAFIDGDEKFFVIVTSTEGGTGSGSSTLLGEYIQEITKSTDNPNGIPVHMVAFTGFEDDVRGLKNTVDWFNGLNQNFIVQAISNKKCLAFTDHNRRKAEELANQIFSDRIEILTGKNLDPSDSNVDNMDLFRLNSTPGYMTVEKILLQKLRDIEQFNFTVSDALSKSVSLETEPSVKRLGVIVDASHRTQAVVDESYAAIKKVYGEFPYDIFRHTQESNREDSLSIIVSGMKMPIDEITAVYNKFKKAVENTDSGTDAFFGKSMNTQLGDIDSAGFSGNSVGKDQDQIRANKNSFFAKYGGAKKQIIQMGDKVKDEL
jgi:cell division GTPase FtsZ